MNTGILVPATLAAGVIATRAIVGNKRAPYPYEYMSWFLVYGGAGIIGEGEFGEAVAWAWLVAMLVAPTYADIWKQIPVGKAVPAGKNAAPTTTTGLPPTG